MKTLFIFFTLLLCTLFSRSQVLLESVDFSYQTTVNPNLHGFNTTGFFQHCLCEPATIEDDYCVDAFLKLKPKVLRFPSGAERKFMNLLGESVYDLTYAEVHGYGFNAEEIFDYLLSEFGCDNFDECYRSELGPDATFVPGFNGAFDEWLKGYLPFELKDDFFDAVADDFTECSDFDDCYADNEDFRSTAYEWLSVLNFPTSDYTDFAMPGASSEMTRQIANNHTQYIDRFITLIDELANNEIFPEVIYVADIHNSTVEQNVEIIQYLLDAGVNVTGVELGNEEYDEFDNANDYLTVIKPLVVELRSNVITEDLKLGVTAAPAGEMLYHDNYIITNVIRRSAYNSWNIVLGEFTNYADYPLLDPWDAYIVHIYLDEKFLANTMDALNTSYFTPTPNTEVTLTPTFTPLHAPLTYGKSDFGNYLFDVHDTYEGISGLVYYYSDYFSLNDPLNNNNLWITEWNTKTGVYAGANDVDFRNTFAHSSLIFLWQLRNMDVDNKDLVGLTSLEYNTLQNAIGDYSSVISPIKENDTPDPDPSPGNDFYFNNDFRLRTHYYSMLYTSIIATRNLKKIELDFYNPFELNHWFNMFGYVPESLDTLYIYFNNNANLNPITIPSNLFICSTEDCDEVPSHYFLQNNKIVDYIDAQQLYSTAGAAPIYDENTFYNGVNDPVFEIIGLNTTFSGDVFYAPKYSFGIIKCPIIYCDEDCRKQRSEKTNEFQIIGNPSNGNFGILSSLELGKSTVVIINSVGETVYTGTIDIASNTVIRIDAIGLPNGIYTVSVNNDTYSNSNKIIIE